MKKFAARFTALVALGGLGIAAAAGCGSAPKGEETGAAGAELSIVAPPIVLSIAFGFNAAWEDTNLVMTGTPDVAPAVASWGPNRLDVFTRSGDALSQSTWQKPGGWSAPYTLAHGLVSDVSASTWNGNRMDLVWHATDNTVTHFYWNTKTWVTESLGGNIQGKPSIVATKGGLRGDVFVRANNTLWHRGNFLMTNQWGAWESIGLPLDSDPVAVSSESGRIDIFWRANDGSTRRYAWDGRPVASGGDGSLYGAQLAGKRWTTMPSLGGYATDPPSVAVRDQNTFEVFVRSSDDKIYENRSTAYGAFAGWKVIGSGCSQGTPAAVANDYDHVDLVVRDESNNHVMRVSEGEFPSATAGPIPVCCGQLEQPLCINQTRQCAPGLGDDTATSRCIPCGRTGDACCNYDAKPCNDAEDSCYMDSSVGVQICMQCGGPNELACTSGPKCGPHTRLDTATGRCDKCGDEGQASCGGQCNFAPATVVNGLCQRPPTCGLEGLDCCDPTFFHGDCNGAPGLVCVFRVFDTNVCRKNQAQGAGGTGLPLCANGAQAQQYDFCVRCTYEGSAHLVDEFACSAQDAQNAANAQYGRSSAGETCTATAGSCPTN